MVKVLDNGEILPVENWQEHEDMKKQIQKDPDSASKNAKNLAE